MKIKASQDILRVIPDNVDVPSKLNRLYAFDFDGTIAKPKGKRVHPRNADDWEFVFDNTIEKLTGLNNEPNASLVIFSNQKRIGKSEKKQKEMLKKLQNIFKDLGFEIIGYFALDYGNYRKPDTGMFTKFISDYSIEKISQIKFVGDAAGRDGDFSCSDRKFADNLMSSGWNVEFLEPEQFFKESNPKPYDWGNFVPSKYIDYSGPSIDKFIQPKQHQELILTVGSPASSKTSLAKTVFKDYTRVNQDTLGTRPKCIKAVKVALAEGNSVIVDNTNPSKKVRSEYIKVAKQLNIPVRVCLMTTPKDLADHLNVYRTRISERRAVPKIAFTMFYKYYEVPSTDEGIQEIIQIPFIPNFSTKREKDLFLLWS